MAQIKQRMTKTLDFQAQIEKIAKEKMQRQKEEKEEKEKQELKMEKDADDVGFLRKREIKLEEQEK